MNKSALHKMGCYFSSGNIKITIKSVLQIPDSLSLFLPLDPLRTRFLYYFQELNNSSIPAVLSSAPSWWAFTKHSGPILCCSRIEVHAPTLPHGAADAENAKPKQILCHISDNLFHATLSILSLL